MTLLMLVHFIYFSKNFKNHTWHYNLGFWFTFWISVQVQGFTSHDKDNMLIQAYCTCH